MTLIDSSRWDIEPYGERWRGGLEPATGGAVLFATLQLRPMAPVQVYGTLPWPAELHGGRQGSLFSRAARWLLGR